MINLKRLPKKPAWLATLFLVALILLPLPRIFAESVPVVREAAAVAADKTPVKPYSRRPSKDALKWADKQLKQMSLEQKVGQLISVGVNATYLNQDSAAFNALRHQIVDNHVGGIILFRGPVYESVVLVNRMQELAKMEEEMERAWMVHCLLDDPSLSWILMITKV